MCGWPSSLHHISCPENVKLLCKMFKLVKNFLANPLISFRVQTPPALSKTDSSIIWELPKKTKLIYNHKHWSQTHQTLCFQVLQWLRVLEFTFLRNAPRPEFTLDWGLLFQCQTDSLRDRIERPLFDLGWNHQPDSHWAYSE